MKEYKLFAQRIGLVGVTNLLSGISGVFLLPILTKHIPVQDYGIWAQVGVTTGLLSTVIMLGLSFSMIRFLASVKDRETIAESFYSMMVIVLITSAAASMLVLSFSGPISTALFNSNQSVMKIISLLVLLEPLNNLLFNYFRTFQRVKRHSLFIFLSTYLSILLVAVFVIIGWGIYGALIGLLLTRIFLFAAMFGVVVSEIGIRIPMFRNMRSYLALGLPTVPEGLAGWTVNSSDRYLISFYLGTAFVGFYSPGYLLGNMISLFIAPLSFLLPSVLSKHYDENNLKKVEQMLGFSMKYYLALAIPSTFGLSLLAKPILAVLSTPQIVSQSYLITPFIALSSLLLGVFAIISNIIVLKKRTVVSGSIWVAAAVLNILLNLFFIPHFGIIGAAETTLIAFFFIFVLTAYYSFKHIRFDIDYQFIMKSLVASVAMSLLLIAWVPVGMIQVSADILACAIIYFAVLLALKGFRREELSFFSDALLKRS